MDRLSGLFVVLLLFSSCSVFSTEGQINRKKGTVEVFQCSRGCYQFLLNIDDQYYYPEEELDEEFRALRVAEPIKIRLTGRVLDETRMVYKPSAHETGVPDFEIKVIRVRKIEKI